ALVATLAALAALGRAAFAPLPNVKPTTDIALLSGYALGAGPGFVVGAVGALASNLFFGHGPHTPWQMAGWGGAGILGAMLARAFGRELARIPLAAACGFAGLLFGLWMDLHLWVVFTDHRPAEYAAISARSLPFNLAHIAGNVAFCLLFGPALVRALMRFRLRFHVVWKPAAATAGALLLLTAAPAAAADRAVERAVAYLRAAQTDDGGFAGAKGAGGSNAIYSGWAVIGLAAAGEDPGDEAAAYLRDQATKVRDLGDVERTILALRAAGERADDLVDELVRRRERDGSIEGLVNRTAFLILSLRASDRPRTDPVIRAAARWLVGQQNRDGGFGTAGRGSPPSIDDTSAAIQALVAARRRRDSRPVRRAAAWLVRRQGPDGGFPLSPRTPSNAQSTAWAIQGLVAAGRDPRRVRRDGSRTPIAYLKSLQGPDGAIRFNRTSRQTPTWVTAQAIPALTRRPLPVRPPRAARAAARKRAQSPLALLALAATALFP
ncbi:MAG TPA: prenyltransferase/squalene oxidase repeat-containing protein, partial [Solirubrobacteraceae bacterium]|nr:prenyltransferase/squalene oxidase repeat-containing protein [Solirubrobacteraceae bacterium]